MFDLQAIQSALATTHLEFHAQLASTNDRAIELAKSGALLSPALILAQQQISGRGQRGHSWWSSQESLTCSWCFRRRSSIAGTDAHSHRDGAPRSQGLIPLAAAQAIVCAMQTLVPDIEPQVKWPNDILIDGRKVAGILVETVAHEQSIDIVVGIGINVNQAALPEIEGSHPLPATSLRYESKGELIEMTRLLVSLVQELERTLLDRSLLDAELVRWANTRLFQKGQKICFVEPNNLQTTGILEGIGPSGGLIVRTEEQSRSFFSGSIRQPAGNGTSI